MGPATFSYKSNKLFKRAYGFSLTGPTRPPTLAELSTYRDDADVGSIYLIRHGQASFGAKDYDVLSPLGMQQSQVLGAHMARLGLNLHRAIAGSLRRQQDTGRLALAQMAEQGLTVPPLETDAAFNEFDAEAVLRALLPALLPDEPDAMDILRNAAHNRSEFQRLFALIIARWHSGEHGSDGLESWEAFVGRVADGLQRLLDGAKTGQHIAVFTSGGSITALLHRVTGLPASQCFELNWQIVNTSLNQLRFNAGEVALAMFNSHSHLLLEQDPALITYR